MKKINVTVVPESFMLDDAGLVCLHDKVIVEAPCCNPGTQDCACKGQLQFICQTPDCTGFDMAGIEVLMGGVYA